MFGVGRSGKVECRGGGCEGEIRGSRSVDWELGIGEVMGVEWNRDSLSWERVGMEELIRGCGEEVQI